MEWTTHAMSGVVLGYTVTNDWKFALFSGATALIPDLDEPKSKFGKLFFFISIPLNRFFGHRTFTHSLLFTVLIGIVFLFFSPMYSLSSILGVLAHIFGDMLTGRVQFLYPMKKKIGLKTSGLNYLITDRLARLALLLIIVLFVSQDVFLNS